MSKHVIAFVFSLILVLILSISIHAADDTVFDTSVNTAVDTSVSESIEDPVETGVPGLPPNISTPEDVYKHYKEPVFSSTSDSIGDGYLDYELSYDEVTQTIYMTLKPCAGFGYTVYDDPSTTYIDGIRVNGEQITSYKFAYEQDTEYTIIYKFTYSKGADGTLAKLFSEQLTFETIIQNPVISLQVLYYAISVLVLIGTGIAAMRSRKKKVRTSNEIASQVDVRAEAAMNALTERAVAEIFEKIVPLITKAVDTNANVVKAITLSTSKSKDAPVALLDLFKETADSAQLAELIENIKANVIAKDVQDAHNKQLLSEALAKIANPETNATSLAQEVTADETNPKTTVTKSVF